MKNVNSDSNGESAREQSMECPKEYMAEQTNDEWFCGLSTEEKAEFFHKQMVTGYYLWTNENDLPRKEYWVKWLKEVHEE